MRGIAEKSAAFLLRYIVLAVIIYGIYVIATDDGPPRCYNPGEIVPVSCESGTGQP